MDRRGDQQHVQEAADERLSDDQPHDQARIRLVGQDSEPFHDLSERGPAVRPTRPPPVRLLPHPSNEYRAAEADRRAHRDDQVRAGDREENAGESRANEDRHALEHARPDVPGDELVHRAGEPRHESVVRRTVRPPAERAQRNEHVNEPRGAAQSQDHGGEAQRRPARALDGQQEALPGYPSTMAEASGMATTAAPILTAPRMPTPVRPSFS